MASTEVGASQDAAVALGELAERLVPVAADLVVRVHEEGRQSITALLATVPSAHLPALAVVLAAMVSPEAQVADLLAWVTFDEHGRPLQPAAARPVSRRGGGRRLQPCGTRAAYLRHRSRGEQPCPDCVAANRAHERRRYQRRRARAAAA